MSNEEKKCWLCGGRVSDDTYVRDILIVGITGIIAMTIMTVIGLQCGNKGGYIQCLQDMKHGNPPAYVLVEQPDGTTVWESNKEKGK